MTTSNTVEARAKELKDIWVVNYSTQSIDDFILYCISQEADAIKKAVEDTVTNERKIIRDALKSGYNANADTIFDIVEELLIKVREEECTEWKQMFANKVNRELEQAKLSGIAEGRKEVLKVFADLDRDVFTKFGFNPNWAENYNHIKQKYKELSREAKGK